MVQTGSDSLGVWLGEKLLAAGLEVTRVGFVAGGVSPGLNQCSTHRQCRADRQLPETRGQVYRREGIAPPRDLSHLKCAAPPRCTKPSVLRVSFHISWKAFWSFLLWPLMPLRAVRSLRTMYATGLPLWATFPRSLQTQLAHCTISVVDQAHSLL
jgi:hypothetical protein